VFYSEEVPLLIAEDCISGLTSGIDSTNSHVYVKTMIEGGTVEHQQISLSIDSGRTGSTPAFTIQFEDQSVNTATTPCQVWVSESLALDNVFTNAFSRATLNVGDSGIVSSSGDNYCVSASDFVEGVIDVGDIIDPGNSRSGTVQSVAVDGLAVTVYAPDGCAVSAGDPFYVIPDLAVAETTTTRHNPHSKVV
jgi:hypothetical protein